jgi:hypothetical protein
MTNSIFSRFHLITQWFALPVELVSIYKYPQCQYHPSASFGVTENTTSCNCVKTALFDSRDFVTAQKRPL